MTPHPAAPLEVLIGMTVTRAEIVRDYIQLAFGTDIGVSIFNVWRFAPETATLPNLIGPCDSDAFKLGRSRACL
jgi:hypothetical protein